VAGRLSAIFDLDNEAGRIARSVAFLAREIRQ
jgi:hypothetical protein